MFRITSPKKNYHKIYKTVSILTSLNDRNKKNKGKEMMDLLQILQQGKIHHLQDHPLVDFLTIVKDKDLEVHMIDNNDHLMKIQLNYLQLERKERNKKQNKKKNKLKHKNKLDFKP